MDVSLIILFVVLAFSPITWGYLVFLFSKRSKLLNKKDPTLIKLVTIETNYGWTTVWLDNEKIVVPIGQAIYIHNIDTNNNSASKVVI